MRADGAQKLRCASARALAILFDTFPARDFQALAVLGWIQKRRTEVITKKVFLRVAKMGVFEGRNCVASAFEQPGCVKGAQKTIKKTKSCQVYRRIEVCARALVNWRYEE